MLGDNIKKIMSMKKITSKELADRVGVTATHISYILNNKRQPSMELLQNIADILNVSVNDFFKNEQTNTELNKKDIKEIDEYIAEIEKGMEGGLLFDGEPISEESKKLILDSLRVGAELAKKQAKEKFTPKKYRQ